MADQCHLPVKIETEDEEFVVQLNDNTDYEDGELLSPNQSGDFSEYHEYQDGSGKFRLKRRRKCGQCGPCQVKENCLKCRYCVRRDVLKQSCVYRKCLYLRKKVPRIRHDSHSGGYLDGSVRSVPMQPSLQPVSPPVMCVSPEDGLIRSPINSPDEVSSCHVHAASPPLNSMGPNLPGTPVQSPGADIPGHPQSVDHLGGFQPGGLRHRSPDNMRSYSRDSVRSHSVERPRSLQGDARPMSCEAVATSSSNQGHSELVRHLSTNPYEAHLNSLQHMQNSSLSHLPKDQINPRTSDQLRHFDAEQYRTMSSRPMMPHPAIPNPYAFPGGNIPQVSPATMGLSRACRYSVPGQSGFPPHFGYNSGIRPRSFGSSPIMSPPFYPPPHPDRSSLPSFPIGQFPHHGAASYNPARFHTAHPAMYPGSLYPSFRPQNEHFIYHAHLPPPWSVFSEHGEQMSAFRDTYLKKEKDDEEHQKFDVFRLTKKSEKELMQENYTDEKETSMRGRDSESKRLSSNSSDPKPNLDEDLVQKINSLSREDQCNVTISIDDLKMQAFIRSDGVNNLEIEIESPGSTSSPESSVHKDSPSSVSSSDSCSSRSDQETGSCEPASASDSASQSKQTAFVKHTISGTVCLKQDLGDEGIIQLELPGHRVQIEDLVLKDDLVKQSDNPEELLKFISSPASSSPHFSEDIIIK